MLRRRRALLLWPASLLPHGGVVHVLEYTCTSYACAGVRPEHEALESVKVSRLWSAGSSGSGAVTPGALPIGRARLTTHDGASELA